MDVDIDTLTELRTGHVHAVCEVIDINQAHELFPSIVVLSSLTHLRTYVVAPHSRRIDHRPSTMAPLFAALTARHEEDGNLRMLQVARLDQCDHIRKVRIGMMCAPYYIVHISAGATYCVSDHVSEDRPHLFNKPCTGTE